MPTLTHLANNPNLITESHDPVKRLSEMFYVKTEETILKNSITIKQKYDEAVRILVDAGHPQAIQRLTSKLVPVFGSGKPKLRDQKVGGIPDLSQCIYARQKCKYVTSKIWPKCGCCHTRMKFVGQFDLLPWMLPIHVNFGVEQNEYGVVSLRSQFNRRLMEYTHVLSDMMLHVFTCPYSGQHYFNPGFDTKIFMSDVYRNNPKSVDKRVYLKSIPRIKHPEDSFSIEERKIDGWEFRLELDEYSHEELKETLDTRPDIFYNGGGDFTLFGAPQSQQEPTRYFSTGGTSGTGGDGGPNRMTPFVSFDDKNADFTRQIYVDFDFSEGFVFFGKVDGSCT